MDILKKSGDQLALEALETEMGGSGGTQVTEITMGRVWIDPNSGLRG